MTGLYSAARRLAFAFDAERVHRAAMSGLRAWSSVCRVDLAATDVARDPRLQTQALGLTFANPIGLAAGFDKDAECVPAFTALGFGFVEVGTVTRHPQPGNARPRLFRLPEDGALLNRLGFNNHGAVACAERLAQWRRRGRVRIPVGVNIGKSKITDAKDAAADYGFSFAAVADVADYVVVNVSSPNTPGLRDLQQVDALAAIFDAVQAPNAARAVPRPLLVKVAPDLADDDAIAIARLCVSRQIDGLIVSNTTVRRDGLVGLVPDGPGGISGRPLRTRSTELLRLLHDDVGSALCFVGVGGVEGGNSAAEKLLAGATLVQAYTGFVYGGPGFVRCTARELLERHDVPRLTSS